MAQLTNNFTAYQIVYQKQSSRHRKKNVEHKNVYSVDSRDSAATIDFPESAVSDSSQLDQG